MRPRRLPRCNTARASWWRERPSLARPTASRQRCADCARPPSGDGQEQREEVMKAPSPLLMVSLALCAPFVLSGPSQAAEAPRPHVVFILADDLGWKDVGYHGSEIKTPHIDKLATSGVRLEQFYVL